MRFLQIACALALLAPSLASANELLRIYELAVQNDTTIRAAAAQRDAARQAQPIAFGSLLPSVNATGSLTEETFTLFDVPGPACSDPVDGLGGEPKDGDCTITTSPYRVTLSATMPLLNWELLQRWGAAGKQVALAQVTYRSAQQQLALRVAEAYFNLLATADSMRFADAEKQAVERQLELAKRRFEVGLSAITDVQEAQARYDLTVAQMIESEQALTSAETSLAEITGSVGAARMVLKDEIPLLGPNPDSVAEWLKVAADGNLDILSAQLIAEAAEKDADAAFARHYPTLNLAGNVVQAESTGFNRGEFRDETLSLQLNIPIFAGLATQAAASQARSTLEQRRAELEGRRRQIERVTKNAYQGVIAGVSRVKALKQAVLSNTTALEASEVGLEVGARTAVDVLNAQRELYRAQRDYARSRYDYLLNILRLKSAAGQLGKKDLVEIDGLLTTPAPVPAATPTPESPTN